MIGSCIDILTIAEVRAERYAGKSEAFVLMLGGELSIESSIVGKLERATTEAVEFGGGESKWARREYIWGVK